jgi:hypothetical protein
MSTTTLPARSPDQYGLSRVAPGIWFVQGDAGKRPANNTDPTCVLHRYNSVLVLTLISYFSLIFLFGWSGCPSLQDREL